LSEFLLEIGCEELPSRWVEPIAKQLGKALQDALVKERLEPSALRAVGASRRLVAGLTILDQQEDREERSFGPSLKVAKDKAGGWSKAAGGFARKHGIEPDALQQAPKDEKKPAELHLLHVEQVAGRKAGELLPGVIGSALRSLGFPKRMSWDAGLDDGKGALPFGRPIRWIVALLDGTVVDFAILAHGSDGLGDVIVRSGNETRGDRFLAPSASAAVASFDDLQAKLLQHHVMLEPQAREERIRAALAKVEGAEAFEGGNALIREWRDLVEYPTVVFGNVPESFQSLPREVLETVLVHHQKYLPLSDGSGRVTRFAALIGGAEGAGENIVRNMERVVVARLRDGAFFLEEDLKKPLQDRLPDLEGVTLHRKLGSYADKVKRTVRLIEKAGNVLDADERKQAVQAAELAKADLTTLMVGEFPELQGAIGGIYLEKQGDVPRDVAEAVRWHYHPLSSDEGAAPAGRIEGRTARVFSAVSLADKLDSLAAYFGIGMQPTGSRDPYALRRAGQGAVTVLLDLWDAPEGQRPSLREWAHEAVAGIGDRLERDEDDVARDVESFLLERLRHILGTRGFPMDEVDAVLGAREPDALDDPRESLVRLRALHGVRSEAREDFERLAGGFKRAKNILGDSGTARVQPDLFQEDAERELYEAVQKLAGDDGGYEARLRSLAVLRAPVDRFFDDVLVMAEDTKLRDNRFALLSETLSLFYRIADISRLGG